MALQNNSNLPSIQRIKYEDYKDAPAWFNQFLGALNLFMTGIYNIVNRGITYSNLGVVAPVTFRYTPGSTTNLTLTNPLIVAPTIVIVGNVYSPTDTTDHPSTSVNIYWHYANGKIFVDNLTGLTTGTTYVIAVFVG